MTSKLYPTYELVLESCKKVLIVAKKLKMSMTANYHLFDMTRGTPGAMLTKKSANYLGKLRAMNTSRTDFIVVNASLNREELLGMMFERAGIVKHLQEGSQPRKLKVVLPQLDENGVPVPRRAAGEGTILDELTAERASSGKFLYLQSKEPVFENGNYRLNFRGRVNTPSVKNFQITPENDIDDILLMFGKCGEDRYHLDYKTPFNAVQAFCLSISQFAL